MHEKLQKVCEEILSDETKTKEFLLVSSIEEMYNFFKGKIPNLSTSEFDDFIAELLENYERMQLEGTTIDDEILQNVSGGAKFGSKITAASLALLMGMPTGSVKAADGEATSLGSKITQKASSAVHAAGAFADKYSKKYNDLVLKIPILKKMPKTKKFLENNPYFAAIFSTVVFIALLTVGGIAIHKHHNKSLANTQTNTDNLDQTSLKEDGKSSVDSKNTVDEVRERFNSMLCDGYTTEKLIGLKEQLSGIDTEEANKLRTEIDAKINEHKKWLEEEEKKRKKREELIEKRKATNEAARKKAEEEEAARKKAEEEEAARKKAEEEEETQESKRATESCKKLTTPSARVSERCRLEQLSSPSVVERFMLINLRETQEADDKALEKQVASTVASYDNAEKRIRAIETLENARKKPNLAGQLVLEELRKTEAADRAALKQEVEQKQEQQKTVQRQAASEKVASYQKQVDDLRAQAAAAQTRVSELQKQLGEKQDAKTKNSGAIGDLASQLSRKMNRTTRHQTEIKKKNKEQEAKQLSQEIAALEKELSEATSASERADQACSAATAKLTAAQKELESFQGHS